MVGQIDEYVWGREGGGEGFARVKKERGEKIAERGGQLFDSGPPCGGQKLTAASIEVCGGCLGRVNNMSLLSFCA